MARTSASRPERQLCSRRRATIRARMNRSRGATSRAALLVAVHGIVLELVVEADVVHVLEGLVVVGFDDDGSTTSTADQRLGHFAHAAAPTVPNGSSVRLLATPFPFGPAIDP